MKPTMKLLSCLALAGSLVTLAACGKDDDHSSEAEPIRPVLYTIATPRPAIQTSFAGTIEPRYSTDLAFRVLGRIIARPVIIGDLVKKDEMVAMLDPSTLDLSVQSAKADLSSAEAQYANAAASEERLSILLKGNNISQADYDAAKQARDSAQAGLEKAQAGLRKAEDQRGYAVLSPDFDGVISATNAEVGQVVAAGQAVMTVARPDIREAVLDIPDSMTEYFVTGTPFNVQLQADPAVTGQGTVREVAPQSDAQTRTQRVRIAREPAGGFQAWCDYQGGTRNSGKDHVVLPIEALFEKDGKTEIWVIDPKTQTVSLQGIQVVERRSDSFVADNVEVGSYVATAGVNELKQGQKFVWMRREAAYEKGFNLSDWALNHRSLVWYFMLVFLVAGLVSYLDLGRAEDPEFTVKTMVVQANWPGASIDETINQVTDRIEKKLEELDTLDYTRSVTTAGKSVVFVFLKDTVRKEQVTKAWSEVRHMLDDIKPNLPDGVYGPYYNDKFGDVFGNIFAFTADGLSMRQLRDYAEDVRTKILTIPNAGKVELIGAQDEAIYLEFSTRQVAALGLDQQAILKALQDQNAITPSGVVQAGPERISVRVSGQFNSEADLRAVNLRVNDRFFRLSDVATITRGYVDPPSSIFRVNGHDAIGLGIGMKPNGNLLEFGEKLDAMMQQVKAELPIGINVSKVADQPEVVQDAVSGFTKALFEAVVIVLAVSFISLGLRAGFVVSLSIPLVLAITFLAMSLMDISLQRVSLGALIISLGLLVDDAMIAVEMMVARLEHGDPINKAATYVYSHTAFPMLTGTLVTIAGFIPIGLNSSQAGEYTFTLLS